MTNLAMSGELTDGSRGVENHRYAVYRVRRCRRSGNLHGAAQYLLGVSYAAVVQAG